MVIGRKEWIVWGYFFNLEFKTCPLHLWLAEGGSDHDSAATGPRSQHIPQSRRSAISRLKSMELQSANALIKLPQKPSSYYCETVRCTDTHGLNDNSAVIKSEGGLISMIKKRLLITPKTLF